MTISEINAKNEEFISKMINESNTNVGNEVIPENEPMPENASEIPDGEDPTVCELEIILSYGELMKMGFTETVFTGLMESYANIKQMVNIMHQQLVDVFKNEHLDEAEASAASALTDLGVSVEKYILTTEDQESEELRRLRLSFMFTDLISIYSEIVHVMGERRVMSQTFTAILGGMHNEDNQTNSEDNRSDGAGGDDQETEPVSEEVLPE